MTVAAEIMWRISIEVPADAVGLCESVLEPHCHAVSNFLVDEDRGVRRVEGLAREVPERSRLETILADLLPQDVPSRLDVAPVEPKDWVRETLHAFPPLTAGRFFIHGSHFEGGVPPGRIGLKLDAGGAFGSGEHPSTRGCLLALDGLRHRRFMRPLDMGCGAGLLGLAMAKTWRVPVLAVDIDPKAIAVARENAKINGLGAYLRPIAGGGYGRAAVRDRGPFDLVAANILANPLIRMARDLAANLAPGGVAVLSGLVTDDTTRVLEAHRRVGLRLVRCIGIERWQTLILTGSA